MVARRTDRKHVADLQAVEDEAGTAAAPRLALDADGVGREVLAGLDERILPDQVAGKMKVDMGAGRRGGQRSRVYPAEFEEIDVAGRVADRRQPNFDFFPY